MNDAFFLGDIKYAFFDRPVEIAWGKNQRDMKFETRAGTLAQLIEALSKFERGTKDGRCLLQGALSGGQRIAKNVTCNHLLMMDFDTGSTLDEAVAEVERRGLFAVLWTTHSHMKPETAIPEAALERFLRKHGDGRVNVGDATVEDCAAYLREEKKYLPRVLEGAVLRDVRIVDGGRKFFVAHQPLPRLRALFVLAEPFDFGKRAGSQRDAIEEWKARYALASDEFGLPWDTVCVDPSRLMFSPRIPPDAEIGPGAHEIVVIAGDAYDFEALPYTQSRVTPGNTQPRISGGGNAFTKAADSAGVSERPHSEKDGERLKVSTPGLAQFLAKYKDFRAAEWYESLGNAPRHQHHNGMDAECPNSESHTTGDNATDRSFRILNGDSDGGWHALCLHQGCKDASGGDRWWYIDAACQRHGVSVESLSEFSDAYQEEQERGAAAEATVLASRALGEDTDALRAAIDALGSEASEAEQTELIRALAARPDGIETVKLGEALRTKLGVDKRTMERLLRAEKKAMELAKPAAKNEAREFGDEGPLQVRPVPKDKGSATVIWTDWSQKDQMHCVVERLKRAQGDDQRIFSRSEGTTVYVCEVEKDMYGNAQMQARPVKASDWTAFLLEHIVFKQFDEITGREKEVRPPEHIVSSLGSTLQPRWQIMDRIVHIPVFAPDGKLMTKRGYVPELKVYLDPDFDCIPVPDWVTDDDVGDALELIFGQALRDFPFSDEFDGSDELPVKVGAAIRDDGYRQTNPDRGWSSRVNTLAMLLQPFARYLINGPCPMYHVDKARPGEGANYLMDVLGVITEGARCTPRPAASQQEEFRKSITAALMERDPILFFDNINHKVDSGELASALTAGRWKDRVLGKSETTGSLPIECVWAFAGNNIQFTPELCRRIVPIRLDSAEPRPEMRGPEHFWHQPLHDWLVENRASLVWACHVLIRKWVQEGMKGGAVSINSFDAYARVMSGIMEAIGLDGFMGNRESYSNQRNDGASTTDEILIRLWDQFKETSFTTSQVYDLFKNPVTGAQDGVLPIYGNSEAAQMTSLGILLTREFVGRVFEVGDGGHARFLKHGAKGKTQYYLKLIDRNNLSEQDDNLHA